MLAKNHSPHTIWFAPRRQKRIECDEPLVIDRAWDNMPAVGQDVPF